MDDEFDAIVVSSEHGVSKPDTAIFEIALAALESQASCAWHVGDSLESDVAGALGAGLSAVWLNRGGKEPSAEEPAPSLQVARLTDLIAQLSR